MIVKKLDLLIVTLFINLYCLIAHATIHIVAAENVYGSVAKQLGGPYVDVINILNSPSGDPHLFNTNPSTAKASALADIIVYNGADYDPWMTAILAIKSKQNREVIEVAKLVHVKTGDNPHLWYFPETMPLFAQRMTTLLIKLDSAHQAYYEQQLNHFKNEYQIIFATIKKLKQQYQTTPVIATEPLFNYMADSIGLKMHGQGFQINMMNDIPPTVSQIEQFEDDLKQHKVRVLIYNTQVIDPLTERMRSLANDNGIPIIGVSEMMPPEMTYVTWMMNQLKALNQGLQKNQGQ